MRLDYTFAELIAERDALRAALEGVIKDATLATDDAAIYEVSYLFINRAREALHGATPQPAESPYDPS